MCKWMAWVAVFSISGACGGEDGEDGEPGAPGNSCSVMTTSPGVIRIACTDGTEAVLTTHDRYEDTEAVAAVEAAGYVHADDLQPVIDDIAEMRTCPADMVDAGEFCIEIDERPSVTDIAQAERLCRADGKRLCTFGEWFYACNDVSGLNDMIGNFEGSANMYAAGGLVSLGSGGSACGNVDAFGGPVVYRCCRSKL